MLCRLIYYRLVKKKKIGEMSKLRKKGELGEMCDDLYVENCVCGGWVTVWVVRCQQRFVGVGGKYSSLLRADRIRSLKAKARSQKCGTRRGRYTGERENPGKESQHRVCRDLARYLVGMSYLVLLPPQTTLFFLVIS